MAIYIQKDLARSYQWETRKNAPQLKGEPDNSLFIRYEGWEVLYIANKFAERRRLFEKRYLHDIEEMLAFYLPERIRSQQKVLRWLSKNWFCSIRTGFSGVIVPWSLWKCYRIDDRFQVICYSIEKGEMSPVSLN